MSKYKLYHLFLIVSFILMAGIGLLWIFHNLIPNPYPNTEIYILIMMYIIMLISTAIIFKTKALGLIHAHIGFHSIKFKPIIMAFFLTTIMWMIDYCYQTFLLNIDMKVEAVEWYRDQVNLIAVFISTVILVPIIEEMLFRGIFLQTLNQYINKTGSALIISLAFALIHYSVLQIPTLFIASLIYVWLTYRYRSIIPAIIAHIINNGLTFLYYILINNKGFLITL